MKLVSRAAGTVAVAFGALVMFANSAPGYALQLQNQVVQAINAPAPQPVPMTQVTEAPLPQVEAPKQIAAVQTVQTVQSLPQTPQSDAALYESLSDAVAAQDDIDDIDDETKCLAIGIYYESRSESLAGQLAVANVILNRTESGRFPTSVCGVLKQRGQFSFVRRGALPTPPNSAQWRKAVAIAHVAQKDLWESPAPDALYFHARSVSASRGMAKVAALGNHVFYR